MPMEIHRMLGHLRNPLGRDERANRQARLDAATYIERVEKDRVMSAITPSLRLLVKLGSIAVHAQELLSPDGNEFNKSALSALLSDPDVSAWLTEMDGMSFLPTKRKANQ